MARRRWNAQWDCGGSPEADRYWFKCNLIEMVATPPALTLDPHIPMLCRFQNNMFSMLRGELFDVPDDFVKQFVTGVFEHEELPKFIGAFVTG